MNVLILGSSDVGSAVAHCLFRAGYRVLIHEIEQPSATRRGMAFTDAVFDGHATLDGLTARKVDTAAQALTLLQDRSELPVSVLALASLLSAISPHVLVDARMKKRATPPNLRTLAPLTIGLGPNFFAGRNVHLAVETQRGEWLGQVIQHGGTRPLGGEPIALAGHARERYIYAPAEGIFHSPHNIGESVQEGQVIAHLASTPLHAPLSGKLRGLTRSSVHVSAGTKIIEIDPRGAAAQVFGIGERPARIAEGVLQAITSSNTTFA
jgi:xanthine dehydrogenase accessory factor